MRVITVRPNQDLITLRTRANWADESELFFDVSRRVLNNGLLLSPTHYALGCRLITSAENGDHWPFTRSQFQGVNLRMVAEAALAAKQDVIYQDTMRKLRT